LSKIVEEHDLTQRNCTSRKGTQ